MNERLEETRCPCTLTMPGWRVWVLFCVGSGANTGFGPRESDDLTCALESSLWWHSGWGLHKDRQLLKQEAQLAGPWESPGRR